MSINLKNILVNNSNNICRTCSQTNDLVSIHQNTYLIGMLSTVTNIQIQLNDELPKMICLNCVKDLNKSYSFISKCKATDVALRQRLSKQKMLNLKIKEESIKPKMTEEIFIKTEITDLDEYNDPLGDEWTKDPLEHQENQQSKAEFENKTEEETNAIRLSNDWQSLKEEGNYNFEFRYLSCDGARLDNCNFEFVRSARGAASRKRTKSNSRNAKKETEEERQRRREKNREKNREKSRKKRATQTREERERDQEKARNRQRKKFAEETKEERAARLAKERERKRRKYEELSPDSRAARLAEDRQKLQDRLKSLESPASRAARLARKREAQRLRIRAESPNSRAVRLTKARVAQRKRLRDESPNSRATRLAKAREWNRQQYSRRNADVARQPSR